MMESQEVFEKMHILNTLIEADKHYKSYQVELLDDDDVTIMCTIKEKIKGLLESI